MTFATYAPRHPVGTGRGNIHPRPMPPLWLVVHTSEQGSEGANSAESLATFIASPASGGNVASYHDITDTDRIIPLVRPNYRANAAGGGNVEGLHVCVPGKASQTNAQWFDGITSQFLEQLARYLADKSIEHGIPLVKLTPAQVATRRQKGVCGHHDITLAFRQSTHTDPGPNFPWDWLLDRARQLVISQSPIPPQPQPQPPVQGGTPVFVAVYANQFSYLVQCNLNETFTKHNITGKEQYLHLIGAGVLPLLNDRGWDKWLETVPEV